MAFQSGTINPLSTSPATDVPKIKNDLAVLRGVIGGTPDSDVPSVWLPKAGGALTGAVNEALGANIASAATPNIASATGNYVQITGTTTITGFTTGTAGTERELRFAGALTLTNSASLILPGGANIVTAAGDVARFRCEGGTTWRCVSYQRADGTAITGQRMLRTAATATTSGSSIDFTGIPSWAKQITVLFNNVSLSGADSLLVQLGTSGGVENTGYMSLSITTNNGATAVADGSAAGMIVRCRTAGATLNGEMKLSNHSGNLWLATHEMTVDTVGADAHGGGTKTLSGVLDRIRLTTTGTDTFDAGSVSLLIEGF